ncbi:single-stranded DNA-binding protein [Salsuginibacillus kocurii]|uniref:single-stranded DNA-binding protein n=1 Tax=Salsuginibacillus kocurii TaxID=427078 RepID=UPI00036BEFD8|nr:single-stranded DNA-binding protein [Salsuginibacillus kocurii]
MNQVSLVGRMTRDPEMSYTKDGIAVTRFTIACRQTFKNQEGEFGADFVPCVTWRKQAENTATYCHKGALVSVTGRVQTRSFLTKKNERAFVVDIHADNVQFLITSKSESNETPVEKPSPALAKAENPIIPEPPI